MPVTEATSPAAFQHVTRLDRLDPDLLERLRHEALTVPSEWVIARIQATACQQGVFHLPTGQVIEEYLDEYLLAADRTLLRDVAAEMTRYVPVSAEMLVGMELGGIPLAVALSAATGIPAGFLRRERKSYGTRRQIEGQPVAGRNVVLVDDVVRSGSQVLRAASVLRRAGASVATAICVLDRGIGGRAHLAENHIVLWSLLTPEALGSQSPVWRASSCSSATRRWGRCRE